MITSALHALLGFTLGLCLVFVLRRFLRRHLGAGSAYALWILPWATLIATMLPTWEPVATARLPVTLVVAGMVRAASAGVDKTHGMAKALVMLWFGGALFALFGRILRHRQLHRNISPLPDTLADVLANHLPASLLSRARVHPAGPAVIWSGRTRLLLPADFPDRFDSEQRRLILEHERTHIRHGDAWWNLLAELASTVFWFHPLVWLARSRLRLDQELACDDAVLRHIPGVARSYAHTLMHGTGHAGTPVLATWREAPQLKERLTMIRQFTTRKPLRRMAVPALAVLFAGGVISAQAMGSLGTPPGGHPPTASMKFRLKAPPVYPAYAIKHHLEGNVMLRVKVGADGKPLAVKAEPGKADPSLVKAAITAAKNWRYHPAAKHGKPVVGWARVPVYFRLGKDSGTKK